MLARWRRWTGVIVVGLVALVGFALAWRSTPLGPWASNDSPTYVGVARNLRDGKGVTSPFSLEINLLSPTEQVALGDQQPLIYWPPGYPVVLAVGATPWLSIESSARLIGGCALAVTMGAIAWLVWRRTRSPVAAVVAGGLYGVNLQTLVLFSVIASDPLFVAIVMTMLCVAVAQLARPAGWRLVAVAVLCAAATMVRLVGVATLPVLLVTALVCLPGPKWRRAAIAGAMTLGAALPFVVWRQRVGAGPGLHPALVPVGRWDELPQWWTVLRGWIVPPGLDGWTTFATVTLLVLLVVTVVGLTWRAGRDRGWQADALLGCFVLAYLPVVLIGTMVFDHEVPIDSRMLAPVIPVVFVLVAVGITRLVARVPSTAGRRVVGALVVVVMGSMATWHIRHDDARLWAPVLQGSWSSTGDIFHVPAIEQAGDDTLVFSNRPSSAYARTGHTTYMLPQRLISTSGERNPREEQGWDELVALAREHPMLIVLVDADFNRPAMAERIERHFDAEEVADTADFTVFRVTVPASVS